MAEDEKKKSGAAPPKVSFGTAKLRMGGVREEKASPPPSPPAPAPPPLDAAPLKKQAHPATGLREQEAMRLFAFAVGQHRLGKLDEAVRGYGRALSLSPRLADVHSNLGVALRAQGKAAAAIACYRRSLALSPDNPGVYSNLGNALREIGRIKESVAAHKKAVELAPQAIESMYNLGLALRDFGDNPGAIDMFDRVLAQKSDHANCRWDRAWSLLLAGDLKRGFTEYEWRWRLDRSPPRSFDSPRWDGSDPKGRTIFVHREQGFGDAIQFARYLPLLKSRGAKVVVESAPELARLFSAMPGVDAVVTEGSPTPRFDAWIPMLSLPHVLGTTLDSIPADVPYMAPPEMHSLHLAAPAGQIKVGIAWTGGRSNRNRSVPLERMLELASVPGVVFYGLQKEVSASQDIQANACEALVTDMGAKMQDFADTAAVVSQLDLVISIDTALVHLAGALGRPVWVMLPFAPDWRWLEGREDSPWYPTMRLFRQKAFGDWDGVLIRLREELEKAVARNRPPAAAAR